MVLVSPCLSIITLNVIELNSLIKRHRVARQITKQSPNICCLQEINFRFKDIHRLKVKGWKKIIMIKGSIHPEDTAIRNIYAPKIRVPKYIKQICTNLKGEIDYHAIILGELQYPTFNNG